MEQVTLPSSYYPQIPSNEPFWEIDDTDYIMTIYNSTDIPIDQN